MELGIRSQIINSIEKIINSNDTKTCFNSFSLISKIFQNILENPNENKFRCLKVDNPNIANKILNAKSVLELFETLGYIKSGNSADYIFTQIDLSSIQICLSLLEGYLIQLETKIYEKDQAKDLELNEDYLKMKNKLEKELKVKNDEKARIAKLINDDKIKRINNKK